MLLQACGDKSKPAWIFHCCAFPKWVPRTERLGKAAWLSVVSGQDKRTAGVGKNRRLALAGPGNEKPASGHRKCACANPPAVQGDTKIQGTRKPHRAGSAHVQRRRASAWRVLSSARAGSCAPT